jgi:hypothetical protein
VLLLAVAGFATVGATWAHTKLSPKWPQTAQYAAIVAFQHIASREDPGDPQVEWDNNSLRGTFMCSTRVTRVITCYASTPNAANPYVLDPIHLIAKVSFSNGVITVKTLPTPPHANYICKITFKALLARTASNPNPSCATY